MVTILFTQNIDFPVSFQSFCSMSSCSAMTTYCGSLVDHVPFAAWECGGHSKEQLECCCVGGGVKTNQLLQQEQAKIGEARDLTDGEGSSL